jgi:hypothetical protein
MMSRVDPYNPEAHSGRQMSYQLTSERLNRIRMDLLYPFYDQGTFHFPSSDFP